MRNKDITLNKIEALRFFGLAYNFWQLTLNISEELIKRGNPDSIMYEGWGQLNKDEYEEHFKWSDLTIIEPTLFNFYHGIELSLKSLILAKDLQLTHDHQLSKLLTKVKELYGSAKFIGFYEKYIEQKNMPSIISDFCRDSKVTIDQYIQSLKYPTSTKGIEFNHSSLRAHGEDGVAMFKEISSDLSAARQVIKEYVSNECRNEIV